jgi:hypothetical protein
MQLIVVKTQQSVKPSKGSAMLTEGPYDGL